MTTLDQYFFEPIFWNWFILAGALLVFELFGTALFFMFWGLAALIVGIITAIFPQMNLTGQLIAFSILSLICIILWWMLVAKRWQRDTNDTAMRLNNRASNLIDRKFQLQQPIVNGFARVQIDDTMWTIQGDDMEAGATVVVTAVDSLILKVDRVS